MSLTVLGQSLYCLCFKWTRFNFTTQCRHMATHSDPGPENGDRFPLQVYRLEALAVLWRCVEGIWVFPKIWENSQIIHFNRVWNHYKPSIFGGFPPIFGNIHNIEKKQKMRGSFDSLWQNQYTDTYLFNFIHPFCCEVLAEPCLFQVFPYLILFVLIISTYIHILSDGSLSHQACGG